MRWRAFEERAKHGEMFVIDGGMGSEVERRVGQECLNASGWTSSMNMTHPDAVKAAHRSYLDAGAHIIIANTYATNRHILAAAGLEATFEENNRTAVRLAREALDEFRAGGGDRDVLIAGSISMHAPGNEKEKLAGKVPWPAPHAEVANYEEQARLLMDAGVDLIFTELVWNLEHGDRIAKALASIEDSVPVCVGISMFSDDIRLESHDVRERDGHNVDIFTRHASAHSAGALPLAKAVPMLTANPSIVGVNIMHTKGHLITPCLKAVRSAGWTGVLGVYPDCGEWLYDSWVSDVPATHLANHAEEWHAAGASLLGGCCGYGPEHISALSAFVGKGKGKSKRKHAVGADDDD